MSRLPASIFCASRKKASGLNSGPEVSVPESRASGVGRDGGVVASAETADVQSFRRVPRLVASSVAAAVIRDTDFSCLGTAERSGGPESGAFVYREAWVTVLKVGLGGRVFSNRVRSRADQAYDGSTFAWLVPKAIARLVPKAITSLVAIVVAGGGA
jgi:hypothetical protein